MATTIRIDSVKIKDVISRIAETFNVSIKNDCNEYSLQLPEDIGTGEIRGINFDNGMGIMVYDCKFNEDTLLDFASEEVHPIRCLYTVRGMVTHSFSDRNELHEIEKYHCAIVANKRTAGNILYFHKGKKIELLNLEIDRSKFILNNVCEINNLVPDLKNLFQDVNGVNSFFSVGFYGLDFKKILNKGLKFNDNPLARKFYLEGLSLQILSNQIIQYENSLIKKNKQPFIRMNDLRRVGEIGEYIQNNLTANLSIASLSRLSGLNPNKLQLGFKSLHNMTVNEYVTNMKLIKALELFNNSDITVAEVVTRIGFESNSYFTKIFKKRYTLCPKDYQKLQIQSC